MQISKIIEALENWAPLAWQEPYDNAGLIVGKPDQVCTGVN
jgi:putative NIF3 family GTP cyclohydrolase 1 type 2